MTATEDDRFEPFHAASPTAHLLDELQLYGHRPFEGDPDPRSMSEPRIATTAIAAIFDAFIATFADTRLEPDLDPLLWATVNLFHRAIVRIERELDDNEQAQHRSQEAQDGSEVRSVELERLTRPRRDADRATERLRVPARRVSRPLRASRRLTLAAACWLEKSATNISLPR